MSRVLVIGASGHIGGLIAAYLDQVPGIQVLRGGRRGPTRIDVADPTTHGVLDEVAFAVNCTDTYSTIPDALYRSCLARPVTLLETSADTGAYVRMYDLAAASPSADHAGQLVPGSGAFPGLSNFVLADHAARSGDTPLELHLRWSVLSEAGPGTCEVMVQAMGRPRIKWVGDGVEKRPPLGGVVRSPFDAPRHGLELGLPEQYLLPRSLGLRACTTFAAVQPGSPKVILELTSKLASWGVFRLPLVPSIMRGVFRLARSRLLRGRTSPLVIHARTAGSDPEAIELRVSDAFAAAGASVATAVHLLRESPIQGVGVTPLENAFELDEVLATISALGFGNTTLNVAAEGTARYDLHLNGLPSPTSPTEQAAGETP